MAFKILITSQKGGVGKSTVAANLSAFMASQLGLRTTLIDWDTHGSSSNWLRRAPNVGVLVQHLTLPVELGGNRPVFEARMHLRRATQGHDIVIADLTWTDALAGELMFEFDMVLVPTSVSEIELAATSGFLSRHRWVFDSAIAKAPALLVCPTRVHPEQLGSNIFTRQRFPVSFMLAPPILESQSARDMFETGYLMNLPNACGESFISFAQAVVAAKDIRMNHNEQERVNASFKQPVLNRAPLEPNRRLAQSPLNSTPKQVTTVFQVIPPAATYSILGRHRQRKAQEESVENKPAVNAGVTLGIPDFLKRFARGTSKV
jgi:cellulose biosynthesis protein BcsQ